MREIEFRGKDIDGKWVYGSLLKYSDDISYISSDVISSPMELVSTNTVGQFTGLLDNNGQKIFEGDLVRTTSKSLKYAKPKDYKIKKVQWNEKMGCWNYYLTEYDLSWNAGIYSAVEVIGNIYDNIDVPDNLSTKN